MKKVLFVLMALLVASPAMAVVGTITFGTPTQGTGTVTIPWTATEEGVVGIGLRVDVTGGTASAVVMNPTTWFDVFLDSAFTIGETYTIGQGIPTASQTAAGELALPGASFSVCAGGLDDDGVGTGTETAPMSGSIVITGTGQATVVLSEDALRGNVVGYSGAMTIVGLPLTTTIGPTVVAPAAPTAVAASDGWAITSDATLITKVRVNWTASANATSYDVYRYTANTPGSAALLGNVTAAPYFDTTTPAANTTYYYWVMAKNSAGSSPFSAYDTGWRPATVASGLVAGQVYANALGANTTITAAMVTNWTNMGKPKAWVCNGHYLGNAITFGSSASRVDGTDLAAVKGSWFIAYSAMGYAPGADLNNSSRADGTDLSWVKAKWFITVGNTGCN